MTRGDKVIAVTGLRRRALKLGVLFAIIVILIALLLDLLFPINVPRLDAVTFGQRSDFAQLVVDRNNRPLRAFADHDGVWRYPIALSAVSPLYIQALLEYEDRWFYWHPGINPAALLRAVWQNWRCHCVVSGGSTLTMQVARRFYPHDRTVLGKMTQMLRALQLEWHFSKDEILTLYLNYAPMGGTIEGVEAASRQYLNKSSAQLSQAEAALLAVLPQAPSRLRPDRHPQRARLYRDKVLKRLFDFGVLSTQDLQQAMLEPVLADTPQTPMLAPIFSRWARSQRPNSAIVHSTLDAELQWPLEDYLQALIQSFPSQHSAAILVMDNASAEVRAYLGSADFFDSRRVGQVDMVQAQRSPGSTLKPFVYGLAIEQGLIHSESLLRDVPRQFSQYQPDNFTGTFSGPVSTSEALRRSLNLPAVQVMEALGPSVLYNALASAGVRIELPAFAEPNLALVLGGGGLSLWQLVQLYGGLANQGLVREPQSLLPLVADSSRWLLSPASAYVVGDMLRSPRPDRARSDSIEGPGHRIAWKTGTSYGYRDAWAVGFTPRYTIGVWFGRPDGTPSPGQYGAITALPVLFQVFDRLDPHPDTFPQPVDVSEAPICWPLGQMAATTPRNQCHQQRDALLVRQQVPPTLIDATVDGFARNPLTLAVSEHQLRVDGYCDVSERQQIEIALWPRNLEPWITPSWRYAQQVPALDPRCSHRVPVSTAPLHIIGLEAHTIVRSSRQGVTGASLVMPELDLQALGGSGLRYWFVNGQFIRTSEERHPWRWQPPAPGLHEIVVMDEQGSLDRIEIEVQ
jgi:penicillin-binding protein 1C